MFLEQETQSWSLGGLRGGLCLSARRAAAGANGEAGLTWGGLLKWSQLSRKMILSIPQFEGFRGVFNIASEPI